MGGNHVPGPFDPLVEWFEEWKKKLNRSSKAFYEKNKKILVCGVIFWGLSFLYAKSLSPFELRILRWKIKWLLREFVDQYQHIFTGKTTYFWFSGSWA